VRAAGCRYAEGFLERCPLIREEHNAELTHDQVESAVEKWQVHRIGLLPIHSLHTRPDLAAFDHGLVKVRGCDRHIDRKSACQGLSTHAGARCRFKNAARMQCLCAIRHDLRIWGKVQRYEVPIIEFSQCPAKGGYLLAGHGCLPVLLDLPAIKTTSG